MTSRLRALILTAAVIMIAAVSVPAAWYLCALIESPIIAPQRESPALWVVVTASAWLIGAAIAAGLASAAGKLAGLDGTARRRWRLLALGVVLATWAVVLVRYAVDPLTAVRWARLWPLFYGAR